MHFIYMKLCAFCHYLIKHNDPRAVVDACRRVQPRRKVLFATKRLAFQYLIKFNATLGHLE